jgi:hypothetical protein
VPLIPLGRYHIINECRSCKAARAIPLRKWKRLKTAELEPALSAYRAAPSDRDSAERALMAIVEFGEIALFQEIAPALEGFFVRNADLLSKVAWAHGCFMNYDKAEEVYLQSIQIEEKPEVMDALEWHMENKAPPIPQKPNRTLQLAAVLVVPAIILIGLIAYLVAAFSAKPSEVYLVSGLAKPYEVLLNGQQYSLRGGSRKKVDINYGAITMEAVPGGLPIATAFMEVTQPFLIRPFSGPAVVINPDRSALLVWSRIEYTDRESSDDSNEFAVHMGESIYVFNDIDYMFSDFPDEIDLPSGKSSVFKQGVEHYSEYSPIDILGIDHESFTEEDASSFLTNILDLEPRREEVLPYLNYYLAPEGTIAFLEGKLERRPVLIEWHRLYQNTVQQIRPEVDIVARYREHLLAEPHNSALAYLLGRLLSDPAEAQRYHLQAIAGPEPCAHAFNALAHMEMNRGNFEAAMKFEQEALRIRPGYSFFTPVEEQILLALGDIEALAERNRATLNDYPLDEYTIADSVRYLSIQGRASDAEAVIDAFLDELAQSGEDNNDDDYLTSTRYYLESAKAEGAGDRDAYVSAIDELEGADWSFQSAVLNGNLHEASKLLGGEDLAGDYFNHLLLYVSASRKGEAALAQEALIAATRILSEGDRDERNLSIWLNSDQPLSIAEAVQLSAMPPRKRVLLAALGTAHPESRKALFTAASKMNYSTVFPKMVLDPVLTP